jgi:hypothetical protein
VKQLFCAQHGASQGIADTNGERRNIRFTLLHDVEMRVEGRGLKHFREGELHLVSQRSKVGSRNLMIRVLNQVQVLDQEISLSRPLSEQNFDFMGCRWIDLAALGSRLGPLSPLAGVLEGTDFVNVLTHGNVACPFEADDPKLNRFVNN